MREGSLYVETLADITDRFRFVEESLVYIDAPVEGFLVHIANGTRYAFRSREIVARSVWHWVLVPLGEGQVSVNDAFASATTGVPFNWLSIIEDRREGSSRCEVVEMSSEKTRPPIEGG